MCKTWGAQGVETHYREIDGTNHFTVVSGLADADSTMVREIVNLVRKDTPRGP